MYRRMFWGSALGICDIVSRQEFCCTKFLRVSFPFTRVRAGFFSPSNKARPSLADGNALIRGMAEANAFSVPMAVAAGMTVFCLALSVPLFNRKQL